MKILAREVQPRDRVTYCGETFSVRQRAWDPVSGLYWFVTSSGAPQFIDGDREVEVSRPAPPDPKPYKVYTRLYKANGDCEKRIHSFATKKSQQSFMDRTKRVVTYYTL